MSSKGSYVFVVITVSTWLLVLFVLVQNHLTDPGQLQASPATSKVALLQPEQSRKVEATTDAFQSSLQVKEDHVDAFASTGQARLSEKRPPTEEVTESFNKNADADTPTPQVNKRSHSPRSSESYKRSTPWREFVSMGQDILRPARNFSKPAQLQLCDAEAVKRLEQKLDQTELDWCKWALSPSGGKVQVGKSYGKLSQGERTKYEQFNCNSVAKGENPSCDDVWGDAFLQAWKHNDVPGLCGDPKLYSSQVLCRDSPHLARFCVFENIAMDFSKMQNVARPGRTDSRKWTPGFLTTHCDVSQHADIGYYEMYRPTVSPSATQCSHVIDETILVYGHDDIKNLGHSMSDFMNVWAMLWLAGMGDYAHDIAFFNMDAIRMGHNYHDDLGTFSQHYELQFSRILKASSFPSDAMVCVKRMIFMPRPLILFTWDGWWTDMKCSLVGPSSLFQRWNTQVRNNYGLLHRPVTHPENKVRVLLIKRSAAPSSAAMYTSRVILNMDELESSLRGIVDAEVIVKDLGGMGMEEQVKLVASVGIVVGVHGAGIPNSMHMSIGSELCCGVIEIFPQGEFSPIRGYGNMVRRMGIRYQRMDLGSEYSRSSGAIVSASALRSEIVSMIDAIRTKPSCVLPSVVDDPYFDSAPPMFHP